MTAYTYDDVTLLAPSDVIDGDTVWLQVAADYDFGFHVVTHVHARIKFRLARVNAPELHTLTGATARQYTVEWLTSRAGFLRVRSLRPDNYGDRWDAEVIDKRDGSTLSDALLSSGNAAHWA